MLLSAALCFGNTTLPLTTLVNSGAEADFLDCNLVCQDRLETLPLDTPLATNALDGRLISKLKVPDEFHNLFEVFSKEWALSLPSH